MKSKFLDGLIFGTGLTIAVFFLTILLTYVYESAMESLFDDDDDETNYELIEFKTANITGRFQEARADFNTIERYVATGEIYLLTETEYANITIDAEIWDSNGNFLDECNRDFMKLQDPAKRMYIVKFVCSDVPNQDIKYDVRFSVQGLGKE